MTKKRNATPTTTERATLQSYWEGEWTTSTRVSQTEPIASRSARTGTPQPSDVASLRVPKYMTVLAQRDDLPRTHELGLSGGDALPTRDWQMRRATVYLFSSLDARVLRALSKAASRSVREVTPLVRASVFARAFEYVVGGMRMPGGNHG
jgi:hypothetical protein